MSTQRCMRCITEPLRPSKRLHLSLPIRTTKGQTRSYADIRTNPATPARPLKTSGPQTTKSSEGIEQVPATPARRTPVQANVTATTHGSLESQADATSTPTQPQAISEMSSHLLPSNVLSAYRTPYRHPRTHNQPVCQLQLRSFSVRNLEFYADFILRIAQYLQLPASGPVPLPKKIERWTMPRSNFVHKKSQENFERITLKRLITIYDGHRDVVEVFLACVRKWQYYGVGIKANVYGFEGLDVAGSMDKQFKDIEADLSKKLGNFGWHNSIAGKKSIQEMLRRQGRNVPGSPMMEVRREIAGAKNVDLFRDVKEL